MWLNAYGVSTHHVYFVYYLTENLQSGTTYYWRVDAEIDNKISYRGDVWSFQRK